MLPYENYAGKGHFAKLSIMGAWEWDRYHVFHGAIYIYIYRYFQQQKLSVIESTSGCTFNFVSGRFEEKSPAQRKCRWVNDSESDEECHCLDWSWNFNTDVSEMFLSLVDFAPKWICQTLHVMGGKCQMFINVIRAPLKDFEWFPDLLSFPFPLLM